MVSGRISCLGEVFMAFDYELWKIRYKLCVDKVWRFCDLDNNKNSVKCNSTLCVMNNAMQDIQSYFENNRKSSAELCFLIRNIDVIVTGILDINNILLGIGLNKTEKAIEKSFTDKNIICGFRTLRSQILAHPVDTQYINDRGESEIVYLEDYRPFNPRFDGFPVKQKCDYVKRMCKPETDNSYFEPLSIEDDIVPVINVIIGSLELLSNNIDKQINLKEEKLFQKPLNLEKDTINQYIISLDKELENRYPYTVENIEYENGGREHYSIVYQCLIFFEAQFATETQEQYDKFLEYVKNELHKIEDDLQQMQFNEDKYFSLLYNGDFAPGFSYECSKMLYLLQSDEKSYTKDFIGNDTPSNALWGIRCFRRLLPCISKYIPVDLSVSDKELYCEYVAANYLSYFDKW